MMPPHKLQNDGSKYQNKTSEYAKIQKMLRAGSKSRLDMLLVGTMTKPLEEHIPANGCDSQNW
jgi:hypothetical protein